MQQTHTNYIYLPDASGEPVMRGFKPPPPLENNFFTAGYGNVKGMAENKPMFPSNRPEWYSRISAIQRRIPSAIDIKRS